MKFRRIVAIVICIPLAACNEPPSADDYRDLNKNGEIDVYEDITQPVEARIGDLLSRISLAENAGLIFINIVFVDDDASLD